MRLHFEQGDDVVAAVVAGADGVLSAARRYVSGNVAPAHSGEIGFRGVIPTGQAQDLPNPTSLHIWCGPDTHAVYYGLDRGELVNLLAVYKPHRLPDWTEFSNRVPATKDQALGIFAEYAWDSRILDLVRSIEGDMSFWALVELPRLPRWSRMGKESGAGMMAKILAITTAEVLATQTSPPEVELLGTFEAVRAEALFASPLQPSGSPSPDQVRRAVVMTLQRLGVRGCAAQAAGEFGEHPDTAVARMRWALATINLVYPAPSITPARDPRSLAFAS